MSAIVQFYSAYSIHAKRPAQYNNLAHNGQTLSESMSVLSAVYFIF